MGLARIVDWIRIKSSFANSFRLTSVCFEDSFSIYCFLFLFCMVYICMLFLWCKFLILIQFTPIHDIVGEFLQYRTSDTVNAKLASLIYFTKTANKSRVINHFSLQHSTRFLALISFKTQYCKSSLLYLIESIVFVEFAFTGIISSVPFSAILLFMEYPIILASKEYREVV